MKYWNRTDSVPSEGDSYAQIVFMTQKGHEIIVVIDNEGNGTDGVRIYDARNDDEPFIDVEFHEDGRVSEISNPNLFPKKPQGN